MTKAVLFKDKVQLAIFIGLVLSGISLSVGFFSSYPRWGAPGVGLGWTLGVITLVMYVLKLILAVYRNTAYDFWADLCLVNMGLAIVGTGFMFLKQGENYFLMLAMASVIGFVISLVLYKIGALNSRLTLVLIHAVIFSTFIPGIEDKWDALLLAVSPYQKVVLLTIAATYIWLPIIISSVGTSRSVKSSGTNGVVA